METFVEITNSAKVRSNSNLVLSGIQANKSGWNPYSFYPNNGVVGVLIGEAQCYEGTIYIVQCGERLLVPVLPSGIRQSRENRACPQGAGQVVFDARKIRKGSAARRALFLWFAFQTRKC